jgi:hypothetical protein
MLIIIKFNSKNFTNNEWKIYIDPNKYAIVFYAGGHVEYKQPKKIYFKRILGSW